MAWASTSEVVRVCVAFAIWRARGVMALAPAPAPGVVGWAATSKVVLGCIAFVVWWVFAVFPAVPWLPIGRTAGSLLGATLMVVLEVISPNEAFEAIDLAIEALLFGTMVVSVYLRRADLFHYLKYALKVNTRGGIDLLCRVCVLAALSSALFTNDTTCVVLTPFLLELCRTEKLHPEPFLLALACSANIGSAATPIGNPQNLVIAVSSGISFGRFLLGVFPAMVVGLVVNTLLLLVFYWRLITREHTWSQDTELPRISRGESRDNEIGSSERSPAVDTAPTEESRSLNWGRFRSMYRRRIWKASVYLVAVGMLAALLAGLSLPWTAMTAAVAMMVLDFSDAGPSLKEVNYDLLVFFAGMFIATSGFDATHAPRVFWSAVEPHSQINSATGVIVLSLVVIILSNVVSNVPTVILLGARVAASAAASGASSDKAWLILAWVSTVAGNLTLIGSAANIIVCEQARESATEKGQRLSNSNSGIVPRATYDLTFWNHLKFGFPSTLIVIAAGLLTIVSRKL